MGLSRKNFRDPSADQREHVLAVALELRPAYTTDAQHLLGRARLVLGDQLQGRVGEHHERRHALLAGALLAPLAEPVEELLVVGGGAVGAAPALLLRARRQRSPALAAAGHLAAARGLARGAYVGGQQGFEEPGRLPAAPAAGV